MPKSKPYRTGYRDRALGGINVLRAEYPTMHESYLTYPGNEEPSKLPINNHQRATLHSLFDHHYTSSGHYHSARDPP